MFFFFSPKQGDGNGKGDEVQLDTEMERVFDAPESDDKFDLSKLQDTDNPENIALKDISQSPTTGSFTSPESTAPSSPTVPLAKLSSVTDEPQISQRTGYGEHPDEDSKRVAFEKRMDVSELGEDSADQKQRRKERHGQKHRKYSLTEYGGFQAGRASCFCPARGSNPKRSGY